MEKKKRGRRPIPWGQRKTMVAVMLMPSDIDLLDDVAKREGVLDELTEIETLYNSGYQYRRRDVITFLNNFDVELDRARNKALPTYMGRPRNVDLDKYDI